MSAETKEPNIVAVCPFHKGNQQNWLEHKHCVLCGTRLMLFKKMEPPPQIAIANG